MNSSLLLSNWGRKLGKEMMKGRQKFKSKFDTHRWNIVRGDLVEVIQGPQTGEKGKVLNVLRADNRLIIEGVNMVSRNDLWYTSTNTSFIIAENQKCEAEDGWNTWQKSCQAMFGALFKRDAC